MRISIRSWFPVMAAAVVAATLVIVPDAEAARGGGGGARAGGGGGGGARAGGPSGGGGGARADGGGGQRAKVDNKPADARASDVRGSSKNNVNNEVRSGSKDVNIDRNVNVDVDVDNDWGVGYHPVARAAVVGTAVAVTAAAVGTYVATVPSSCVPANYAGAVYYECGTTWYQASGSQYVVVNPPQ